MASDEPLQAPPTENAGTAERQVVRCTAGRSAQRWAVYIDIEGFSTLFDREITVLQALGDLLEGIYLIGSQCYPESPDRLFAHQTADGVVIASGFGATSLEVPSATAIALLRHVAGRGRFAKAAIGEGEFADIFGCYPRRIRDACIGDAATVPLGDGLMTPFPVMGTALIDAVGVARRSPSGALLTVSAENKRRLPIECALTDVEGAQVVSVDWVHSDFRLVTELQRRAGLRMPSPREISTALERYCHQHNPPQPWRDNTLRLLNLGLDADHDI